MPSNPVRVMVLDDDVFVATAYAKRFRDDGYDVRVALDPIEGFELLKRFEPQVIVLDLKLPFRSGLDWLAGVRKHERFRDIPVVAVTSDEPDSPLVQEAYGLDLHAVLFKSDWDAGAVVAAAAVAAAHA